MKFVSLVKRLARRWVAHDNSRSAAAIGFYAIFTVAPLLVFATAGVGLVVGDQQAQLLTEERLAEALGDPGARVASEVLTNANFSRHGVVATLASAIIVLYAASNVFFQLRKALDRIFGQSSRAEHYPVVQALLGRLVAALCVILATGLLVTTLVAQVVLSGISQQVQGRSTLIQPVWQWMSSSASAAIVTLVVVVLLKYLPSRPPASRHVLVGAAVCVVLFVLGKWLIGVYISRSVIASAYGPSSAIVAFILWIYYSTQIFILGAEVCQLAADGGTEG